MPQFTPCFAGAVLIAKNPDSRANAVFAGFIVQGADQDGRECSSRPEKFCLRGILFVVVDAFVAAWLFCFACYSIPHRDFPYQVIEQFGKGTVSRFPLSQTVTGDPPSGSSESARPVFVPVPLDATVGGALEYIHIVYTSWCVFFMEFLENPASILCQFSRLAPNCSQFRGKGWGSS